MNVSMYLKRKINGAVRVQETHVYRMQPDY